jgi:hypothetical protein
MYCTPKDYMPNVHNTQRCLASLNMGIEDMGLTQNYDATLHGLSVNPRESWQWLI